MVIHDGLRLGHQPDRADRRDASLTVVEAILLSADGTGLRYRTRSGLLDADEAHPDAVALRLSGLDRRDPAGLVHSTSWRFQHGQVVLTYAVLPDADPDHTAVSLAGAELARSDDPLIPSPTRIEPAAVAVHACRHLAYLRQTDPLVAARSLAAPDLWQRISAFQPVTAGQL